MTDQLHPSPVSRVGTIEPKVAAWAATASILWGTSYLAAKSVVQWLPPLTAATARFLMVAVLLCLAMVLGRKYQPVARGDWVWLMLAGLFQTSFYFALQYAGITMTTASNTSVIVNVRPVFAAIFSALLLHEALSRRKILGIVMAFAGVWLLSTKGSLSALSFGSQHMVGDSLVLLNAVSGGIGLVINKRVLDKYRPFPALVYVQTFGAIGLLPFAAVEIAQHGGIPPTPVTPWLLLLYQAVLSTIIAHWLWNKALARLEASRVAVFIYLAPLTTTVMSFFLLDEAIGLPFVIGALLVLSGAYITLSAANRTHQHQEKRQHA